MEPRPSRPNRSAQGSSRSQRPPWTPPEPTDDLDAPRTAEIYAQPAGSGSGGPWYGPHGSLGPEPPEYRPMKPPIPIKPRGERGNKWIRYLFGGLLLAIVVAGSAFVATRIFGDDDDPGTTAGLVEIGTQVSDNVDSEATPVDDTEAESTSNGVDAEPTPTVEEEVPVSEPTEAVTDPAPTAQIAESESSSSGQQQSATTIQSAEALLPEPSALAGSWSVALEGERSRAEVGAQLGDDGETLLTGWRWRENLYRDFNRTDAESFGGDATFLSVSIHRFATSDGAAEALEYYSDIVVAAQGLQDVGNVPIGDNARGLEGPGEGVNLYVLYVQDGNYLIRLGGSSPAGDPAQFVDSVAQLIVGQ